MKIRSILALAAAFVPALCIGASSGVPTALASGEILRVLSQAQRASHRGDTATADSLVCVLITRWPESPVGYYARAVQFQVKALGCEGMRDEAAFREDVATAIRVARTIADERPDDAVNRYFLGLSLGMEAVTAARGGNVWRAWRSSSGSMDEFRHALERDSSLVDAWLPIGAYHFWRGQALKGWAWLPFIEDTREQGLSEMRRAADEGTLTRISARSMLLWALLAAERPVEALSLADSLVADFPRNRSFRWARAEALRDLGTWADAADDYQRVADTFPPEDFACPGYVELRTKEALMLAELGRCDEALPALERCLEYTPPEAVGDEFEELKEEARQAIRRCRGEETR